MALLTCLLGFAVGVASMQAQPVLPDLHLAAAVPVLLGLAWLIAARAKAAPRGRSRVALALVLVLIACCDAGFCYAAWRAERRLADELPTAWEGRDIELVGVVDALPQASDRGVRFELAVEQVITADAIVPTRLSLAWYDAVPRVVDAGGEQRAPLAPPSSLQASPSPRPPGHGVVPSGTLATNLRTVETETSPATANRLPTLHAGERWQFTVRLKRPHGTVNPHGFDVEAWLLENDLRATGYVRTGDRYRLLTPFAGRATDYIARERDHIRARILRALDGRPYAGVIAALAIGDERAIPAQQWLLFNRTGVGHLISISGLHITGFAALIGGLAYWLGRRSLALTSRLPARKVAAVAGVVAAAVYVLLAGFEVPAQRTLYMLAVAAIGLWLGRPGTAAVVWFWALTAVLVYDPWGPLTPGFWLSFGAVGLLLYIGVGRIGPMSGWNTAVRAQAAITLGLIPLMLVLFQQVSLVSPLANAVAIPVVTFAVVPLTLGSLLLPWDFALVVAHEIFAGVAWILDWLGHLPAAVWQQHAPPLWTVAAGSVGVAWLFSPRGIPGRWLGWVWLTPMFVVAPLAPAPGAFRITVLDVGQGLAVLVQTHAHALLFDTGPRFNESADAGNRIIAPVLRAIGVARLDAMIVSHQDSDHSGGALSLLQTVPVALLSSSLPVRNPITEARRAQGQAERRCLAGQQWTWDGVQFAIIYPYVENYLDANMKPNNLSCVLRIGNSAGVALLPGDIEARDERALLRRNPQALPSDLLIVPHHGSMTSSTPEFIAAVRPRSAAFTPGYRNRFGHPRPQIVARYQSAGTHIYRTDYDGALSFEFDPALTTALTTASTTASTTVSATASTTAPTIRPTRERDVNRRYWRDPASPSRSSADD